jgi:hypothetical protein
MNQVREFVLWRVRTIASALEKAATWQAKLDGFSTASAQPSVAGG